MCHALFYSHVMQHNSLSHPLVCAFLKTMAMPLTGMQKIIAGYGNCEGFLIT
jgi:hypothetical protein